MASTIFSGQVADSNPVISATVNYEHSRDGANMRYRVYGSVYLSTNGYYSNTIEINCYLNGSNVCSKSQRSTEWNWSWDFDSGWVTVSNKTEGSTPFYFTVVDKNNSSWCNYSSGTYYLTVDPAYFTSTPTFRLTSRTETTATFNWSTPQTCSNVQYKINDGSWVDVVEDANSTSGSFTVNGLSANTSYTIYCDFKRRDSGLWAQTKPSQGVSTYAYPYLTSVPKFTVGDALTIGIYNPLGRSCTVYIIGDDGTEMLGGTFTDTSIYPFNSDSWKNDWYKSLPKKKQGTYKARLVCSTGNVDQISSAVEYYLNASDSEFNPTFPADNIINIANTLHTDISGANKFIKNHNKLTGVIKPMVGKRFADITTGYYNISASGLTTVKKNYLSSNIAFELGNMSSDTFNVTAVDGRGFTTTRSKTIDLVDYNNPGINAFKIVRQNGIGTKAIIHFEGNYTNWTGLSKPNAIQSIKYKIGASGTWKALPASAKLVNTNGAWVLDATLDDTFATASQYDLYLQVKDLLETIEFGAYTISTADAFIWKDLANKRMGINKKPTEALDVHGNIKGDGNIEGVNIKSNALYINGVKMIWYE